MPLYEYECEGGHKFEQLHSIDKRFNAVCPDCKMKVHLMISAWGRVIFAGFDTIVGHDGTILSRKPSTNQIPMLPEKVHGARF